jgi:hypothetical protein
MEKDMANQNIDKLIKLNNQGKSLRVISEIVGMSWQQVWRLIHKNKRYIPGKRGFARLNKKERIEMSSKGGERANELGVTYQWNKKTAKEASQKRLIKRLK